MRIVVDTNIVFSAILNTNSKIARIILQPKTKFNFYSTKQLLHEIDEQKSKLKKISSYTETEFQIVKSILVNRIKFINVEFIPKITFQNTLHLISDIDIDDTEFVALTEHIKGLLWTGDKELLFGLKKKSGKKP